MMQDVMFNYVVDGVVVEGPLSYASVLQRSGLKDTVGLTEMGYVEIIQTPTTPEITQEQIQAGIRGFRAHLLQKSDWTQLPDSPLSSEKKAEWATYRQELRDAPAANADVASPMDVVWPVEPT